MRYRVSLTFSTIVEAPSQGAAIARLVSGLCDGDWTVDPEDIEQVEATPTMLET